MRRFVLLPALFNAIGAAQTTNDPDLLAAIGVLTAIDSDEAGSNAGNDLANSFNNDIYDDAVSGGSDLETNRVNSFESSESNIDSNAVNAGSDLNSASIDDDFEDTDLYGKPPSTNYPTNSPTSPPTFMGSLPPTMIDDYYGSRPSTNYPTNSPTTPPTVKSTPAPTRKTKAPTTNYPTNSPTTPPTVKSTPAPTRKTKAPTTNYPTNSPTTPPTVKSTPAPTTNYPTNSPTTPPTVKSTPAPTRKTKAPTPTPTVKSTPAPTSKAPTVKSTPAPTRKTKAPTVKNTPPPSKVYYNNAVSLENGPRQSVSFTRQPNPDMIIPECPESLRKVECDLAGCVATCQRPSVEPTGDNDDYDYEDDQEDLAEVQAEPTACQRQAIWERSRCTNSATCCVVQCRADGSYQPLQCCGTNFCWCLNDEGQVRAATKTQSNEFTCAVEYPTFPSWSYVPAAFRGGSSIFPANG